MVMCFANEMSITTQNERQGLGGTKRREGAKRQPKRALESAEETMNMTMNKRGERQGLETRQAARHTITSKTWKRKLTSDPPITCESEVAQR